MIAPCSRNMLPWWYVCILTIIKWCVRLNYSRIYYNNVILSGIIQRISYMFRPLLGHHQVVLSLQSNESVETTNKIQPCNRIYYSRIYWRLNMAGWGLAVTTQPEQRPVTTWVYTPEAANTVWGSWWWAVCRSKHVEPSTNFGIINSITKLHLVGISTES
jgi:hypothetical protein